MDQNMIAPQGENASQVQPQAPQSIVNSIEPQPEIRKNSPIFAIALIVFLTAIIVLAGYIIYTRYLMAG